MEKDNLQLVENKLSLRNSQDKIFHPVDCQHTLREYRDDTLTELRGVNEIDTSYIKRTITYHPFLVSTHSPKIDQQRSSVFGTGKYYETIITSILEEEYNGTKNEVFVDVGGNIGWFSLLAASMGARVYSFEPNLLNIVRFCESIELNGFDDDINLFWKGVGDEHNQTMPLYKSKYRSTGQGSFVSPNLRLNSFGQIQLLTLDAFAEEAGWFDTRQPIKFLKLDVEGYEGKVIQGGKSLINAKLIENILLEFKHIKGSSMEDRRNMIKILTEAGYELYKHGGFKGPINLVTKKYTNLRDIVKDLEGNPAARAEKIYGANLWFRVKK